MESVLRKKLFRGEEIDFQQLEHSNTVRIFISSTFADMSNERNLLLERAYPSLRQYCQKLGLDFQVMDMRWGIQDNASIEHSICKICLQEIKTCRRLSIGPFFVAFVGNRYGYRPIPSSINSNIFEQFCQIAQSKTSADAALLQEWYKRDDNAVPPCYILQPITSKYSYFDDSDPANVENRKRDRADWENTFQSLSDILRKCAKLALNKGLFNENDVSLFYKSVTQLEIEEGLSEKKENSIYLYFRNIKDLRKFSGEPEAHKFVDKNNDGLIDDEAQELLKKLKTKVIGVEKKVGDVKKYQLNWVSDKGINVQSEDHLDYLERFCSDFVKDIKLAITSAAQSSLIKVSDDKEAEKIDKSDQLQTLDWVLEEVTHQTRFGKSKWSKFCGRKALLETSLQKLLENDSSQPTIIFGESGKGKTALMAKIVQLCLNSKEHEVVAFRFLGTSSNSSNIHNILQSLILQIDEALDLQPPESHSLQNYDATVKLFSDCLKNASDRMLKQNKNLIIVLDSLDQMSSTNGAYRLKWLPKQIPSNIKVLLSTLPNPEFGILDRLRQLFSEDRFIEVTDLDPEDGKEILQSWLSRANRSLNKAQYKLLLDAFSNCPSPLFLKLAFDEARTWYSYTDVGSLKIASTVQSAISLLFDRLEKVHSKLFVSRTFGYMVATRNGITENELDDLLSLDDEVLDNSYQHWSPSSEKIVRIPTLLWSRLRHGIGEDLVERQANGYRVLSLYHRQFLEAASKRYLGESDEKVIHKAIAQYFLGVWSLGKEKPLKLKIWKNKMIKVDRQVASQPNKFSETNFNYRKLSELPFHLIKAGMKTDLYDAVLCNAQWILDKIEAFSIKNLLEDYDIFLEENHDDAILLIRDALKLAKPTLEFSGGVRNNPCAELVGRLAFFVNDFPSTIGKLVKEASAILDNEPYVNLFPLSGCFQPPGGPLRTTLTGFKKPLSCMVGAEQESILVAGSQDGRVIVWLIGEDEALYNFKAHEEEVKCLAVSGPRIVSGSSDNTLVLMNYETERKEATIQEDHSNYKLHASLVMSAESSIIISACGKKINVWSLEDLQCKFSFEEQTTISHPVLLTHNQFVFSAYEDGTCQNWSITTGDKHFKTVPAAPENLSANVQTDASQRNVVFHCVRGNRYFSLQKNGVFCITNLESGETNCQHIKSQSDVAAMMESGDVFACSSGNDVRIFSVSKNRAEDFGTLCYHRKPITGLEFHKTTNVLFVGSKDKTITSWLIEKKAFGINRKPLEVILGMGAAVENLVIFQDIFATGSSKVFYIKLWNWNRKKIVDDPRTERFQENNNAISPCGNYLAVSNFSDSSLIFRHIFSSQSINNAKKEDPKESLIAKDLDGEFVTSLCFCSNDSEALAVGTKSGKLIKVFNPFLNGETSTDENTSCFIPEKEGEVKSLSVNFGYTHLLTVLCNDEERQKSSFHLIDIARMTTTCSFVTKSLNIDGVVTSSCFAQTGSNQFQVFVGTDMCKIYVVVLEEKNGLFTSFLHGVLSGHDSPVKVLTLSHDCCTLFSGSSSLTKILWRMKNNKWELHRRLYFKSLLKPGTTKAVFTKSGKYVLSGSRERSILVWDVESGEQTAAQYVYATVTGLSATDDDRIIANTKMGYVIIDKLKLDLNQSSPLRKESRKKIGKVVRKLSGKKSSENSTVCLIV